MTDRGKRTIIIVILLISVLTISIAFAFLSQNLNINTEGKFKAGNWNIVFENLDYTVTKTATDDNSMLLTSTTINLSAIFKIIESLL